MIKEKMLSNKIVKLLTELRTQISPNEINLYIVNNMPYGVNGQTCLLENGDYHILISPENINDYTLSHELLHIAIKKEM
ncbi:MAG: hypothetical protein K0R50_3352 [Eubacterium sp.]|jgi:hypothetical protein|nr:hypothetical protein [Eubacterium sp.]